MSGGSSRPLTNGETASARYLPCGTTLIARWCAAESATVANQTPVIAWPDSHSSSCGRSPSTAPHCGPTRSSFAMPTVKPLAL